MLAPSPVSGLDRGTQISICNKTAGLFRHPLPGKKVVGTVGIGILESVANPVLKSLGIYGASQPVGVAVTVIVELYAVGSLPLRTQNPSPHAFSHL